MAGKKNGAEVADQGKITKHEAVRRALAELGNDAKPTVIQSFVNERFGINMNKDHVSVCKGKILRNKPTKGKKATKQAAAKTAPAAPSVAPAAPAAKNTGIVLADILAIKALAERVGPDQLRTLIGALAK